MWVLVPGSMTFVIVAIMLGLVLFATRIVQPEWWASRAVRTGIFVAFAGMLAGLSIWAFGRETGQLAIVHAGAGIAYVGVLVFAPAAAVMPVSAVLDRVLGRVAVSARASEAERRDDPLPKKLSRRDMIRFGSASLPAMASMTAASGFVTAKRAPMTPTVTMRYPGLHRDLEGFRILQLSDLHLGAGLGLDDLESGIRVAMADLRPDLIVLTGDLADDAALIAPALALVHDAGARYGALACLGNHEYLHGIEVTRPKYEKSPVPLLVGNGRTLRVGGAKLFVGGSDDPVHIGGDIAWMVRGSITKAASHAPPDADFRLLLCHRPEGFGPANDTGFDLTLSGHTHGGQIGFLGKSLFEKLRPEVFWWGSYAKKRPDGANAKTPRSPAGASRLYTTSGFGQWFPFRLGCPTEMPLIVLTRGDVA